MPASYVWRDPVDALVRGTLPRAMRIGRTVPLSSHSRTHPGARRTVLALLQWYAHDPRVTIAVFENPEGSVDPRLVRRDESWLRTHPEDRPETLAGHLRSALTAERAHERGSAALRAGGLGIFDAHLEKAKVVRGVVLCRTNTQMRHAHAVRCRSAICSTVVRQLPRHRRLAVPDQHRDKRDPSCALHPHVRPGIEGGSDHRAPRTVTRSAVLFRKNVAKSKANRQTRKLARQT